MKNITRVIDSSGSVIAEKHGGREVFNHSRPNSLTTAEANEKPLVAPSSFEATNPAYGGGVDEEPLQAPLVASERQAFSDAPLKMPSCFE